MKALRSMCASVLVAAALAGVAAAREADTPPGFVSKLVRFTEEGLKPEPPITIRLSAGAVSPAGRQEAVVEVTPLIDGSRLHVEILAEDGLSIVKGAPGLERALPRARVGENIRVTLASSGAGERRLIVRARLLLPDGTEQSAVAFWAAERREHSLEEDHPGSRVVRSPDGREVLEMPSRPR